MHLTCNLINMTVHNSAALHKCQVEWNAILQEVMWESNKYLKSSLKWWVAVFHPPRVSLLLAKLLSYRPKLANAHCLMTDKMARSLYPSLYSIHNPPPVPYPLSDFQHTQSERLRRSRSTYMNIYDHAAQSDWQALTVSSTHLCTACSRVPPQGAGLSMCIWLVLTSLFAWARLSEAGSPFTSSCSISSALH